MICDQAYYIAAIAGYSALEFWLGKTKVVKPNSVIELVLSAIVWIIIKFMKGKS